MASCRACSSLPTGTNVAGKQVALNQLPNSSPWLSKNQRDSLVRQGNLRKHPVRVQAEYSNRKGGGSSDFFAGFVLGGVVFGALGYLFAPQVSKLISSVERELDSSKQLPKDFDDDEGLEKTRRNLNEKIAQLNAAIDNVSAQLRADDKSGGEVRATAEFESAA